MTFRMTARVHGRLDAEFTVAPGETVAVLGPNGAGKSTLLAAAAGLVKPHGGSIRLGDKVLFAHDGGRQHWVPPHLRGVALLAQEALLFPHLSVLDNVAFAPRSAGEPRARSRETARRWLAEVDALDLAGRRPGQLSGGQAQRVAVARALAADPELLLLDEPMAALDIHAAPQLRRVLKRVLARRSALIVTHDVLDALMLADRIVVLEKGRIVEEGPVREVLGRPRSAFAAGLAGLNLLTGTVTPDGLLVSGPGAAGGQAVSGTPDGEALAGEPGVAAFPPSAVSVFLELPHGSPRNCLPVAITELEPHAGRIRVHAGELAADITPAASAELGLEPGTQVFFVVKSAEVQLYGA
ncbi:sulfate/molybdate ABC transporter ATP-binding protein [Arthrobacter cupressi]|uniref:Molybdate transport system ATP-binding protein n=1 Tax=Arthrobacter cupressi TaxID=1045773 RepID=A0A1G8QAF4_9MICC|nr:ATP-binding cassette domain-containing protein [Arthrobacter cupressi]SDJ01543.1 molybdate transport system ATP-binding protein [Arthrobacter cupressi]